MSSLQEQINQILAARKERLSSVVKEKDFWNSISENFSKFSDAVQAAESKNPCLSGLTTKVRASAQTANDMLKKFSQLTDRFNRDDICIGIGGAARMGKSTFLQAVTGLGDDQIPTSDKFFTTAGRSLIVNATEAVAIADMHTERSFLEKVIAPMCKEIGIQAPASLEELEKLNLPQGDTDTQQKFDVIKRLSGAIKKLSSIRPELTGQKQRQINIKDLRDFVAYPEGGMIKAGKFMAVDKITIYAPFPGSEVKQLRVVDLPGLGEAGRNLAEVQTEGMQDVCDATLLMKRPAGANVEWTLNDTTALDAIKKASPLQNEQPKYTAILANVDGDTEDDANACVESIKNQLSKDFEIIRCDARDREAVTSKTMPEILRFLAKNLPDLDNEIFKKTEEEAEQTKKGLKETLEEVQRTLGQLTALCKMNFLQLAGFLQNQLAAELSNYAKNLQKHAEGTDEEWNAEVKRVTDKVKEWITNGCGYGSRQQLVEAVRNNILTQNGLPQTVVNQVRIAFRKQWEEIDEHLQERIAKILDGFVQAIQKHTNSFVPEREQKIDQLLAVRNQLKAIAQKLIKTPDQQNGDSELLQGLATPLYRLAEFDIKFRFHLEPTLIAATKVLAPTKLPIIQGEPEEAEGYTTDMLKVLTATADDYSKAMQQSRELGDGALRKNKHLIEGAVKDPNVRNLLINMIQGAVTSSLSFSPNRIFAAVIENAKDAFLFCNNATNAFIVWSRGYLGELSETPTPAERAAMNAYIEASDMLNKIQ